MHHIFKYPLEVTNRQIIQMPKGADILCIQVQKGLPCLWVNVNDKHELQDYIIETFGTGHNVNFGVRKYIGTYQLNGGSFVGHVFKATEIER